VTQTDDDAKTRAQKEKLDEITTTENPPKLARDSTMAVTAKVLYRSLYLWYHFVQDIAILLLIKSHFCMDYNRKVQSYWEMMRGVKPGGKHSNKQMNQLKLRLLRNQKYHGTLQWLPLQRQVM